MKWKGRRRSDNVKDYRGSSRGVGSGGSNLLFGLLTMFFRGGITKTKIIIVLLVVGFFYFFGNPLDLLSPSPGVSVNQAPGASATAEKDELYQFVEVVMADTEDVWNKLFSEQGADYAEPDLIVFNGTIRSGCGGASSA